jgi:hypothetical protein
MKHVTDYPTGAELMAQASALTGLTEFGPSTFLRGLDELLQSLAEDAKLTEAGRAAVLPIVIRRLVNRLQIEDWFRRYPEAESAALPGPISITGLPRTGTTALANMMSLDPQFRCLRSWEQAQPCPPPVAASELMDPRRLAELQRTEIFIREHPEQKTMHLYEIDATVEDTEILGLEFSSQQMVWPISGYHAWWREADMRPAFTYHRRVALLLQSCRPPNRWLFKAPHHKFHLEAFVHAYPGTRFVFTHRDPAKVVPSYVSLVISHYPPGALDNHDVRKIGMLIHEHLLRGMHRAVEARGRLPCDLFVDLYQQEIDINPLVTLQRVYEFLGLEFTTEMRFAVTRWHKANQSGTHGRHRYTAEQFGLSVDRIRSDYDFYTRHFDVPIAS